jgi:predicted ferric reductase
VPVNNHHNTKELNTESLRAGADAPACNSSKPNRKEELMLYTLAVVLLILWLLGLVSGYAKGGLIHLLLVVAVVMVLLSFISGRRRSI